MKTEKFEKLVAEGVNSIPQELLKKLENVEIVIEQEPPKNIKRGKKSVLLGLYEGIPRSERWHYGQVLPDKITIFKKEIERFSKTEDEIKETVKNTVWHEIAHHFGIGEKKVRDLERKKGRRK